MKRGKTLWVCILLSVLLGTACAGQEPLGDGQRYEIYYVNNEETKTLTSEYVSETRDTEALLGELLGQLAQVPAKFEYEAPLAGSFRLLGYTLDNGTLTLDFDGYYRDMDAVKEVLTRAAIVRTLTQIPGVTYVAFTVQGEVLTDSSGAAVGTMSSDLFIDNAGNEINAYEKVNLKLYFADRSGMGLVEENRRNVVYSSNISLEKLVVEKLIAGPETEGACPVVDPQTKIIGVTVRDGTCYVNLDQTFLNQPYNVSAEVTIYSIANSLVELSNVNRVQISVGGETNLFYREKMNLNDVYERNLDLLVTQ